MYLVFDMQGVIVTETDDLDLANLIKEAAQIAKQDRHFLVDAGSLAVFNEGRWSLEKFGQGPLSTQENHLFEI